MEVVEGFLPGGIGVGVLDLVPVAFAFGFDEVEGFVSAFGTEILAGVEALASVG